MMGAATRLHADNASWQFCHQIDQRVPPNPPPQDYGAGRVQTDNTAYVLAEIDAKHCNLHGPLLRLNISDETISPGGRGGPFHKLSRTRRRNPQGARTEHIGRSVVPRRDAGWPKEQDHLPLGQDGFTSASRSRSTHPIGLSVRCGLPRTWNWRSPRAAGLQHPSHAAPPRRNRNRSRPRCSRHSHPRSSRMAWCKRPQGSKQYLALAAAAALARTQSPRKHLAVHASKLVVEPRL